MKWELVGKQELWEGGIQGKGHAYAPLMWRTPVPGGWLLMIINSKSSDPQPTISFYPDPDHAWNFRADPQSEYLLRPAHSVISPVPENLLQSLDDNAEQKRLESSGE